MKNLFLVIVLSLVVVSANAQRTPVKVSLLPEPLPKFLNTNYPGFVIEKAERIVTNNNEVSYETVITKGTTKETLVFDKNGTFLRKQASSKPIQAKSNVNTVEPGMNKNATTKQPAGKINKIAQDREEEEPIQMNKPNTKNKKK